MIANRADAMAEIGRLTQRIEQLDRQALSASPCSLKELIEDELRDLWQWGYDREPREESVQPRIDAIMRIIKANVKVMPSPSEGDGRKQNKSSK